MAKQWSDVELWAMAEQLSEIMDALRNGESRPNQRIQYNAQPELPLGPGGNIIAFDPLRERTRRRRMPSMLTERTAT